MTQILVYDLSNDIYAEGKVEKGVFENDPSRETYRITGDRGVFYAVTEGFTPYDVDEVPEDFENYTYTPEDGFVKKEFTAEELEIDRLRKENEELKKQLGI